LVSIYIANVTILLDNLNLWQHFTKRVSTIYLPNKKLPMLPNILSDTLCSLQENKKRLTFHLDIIINHKNEIETTNYGISVIKCYKNFKYEEESLLQLNEYNTLFNLCKDLPEKYLEINNSHDLVAYLMILMNYYISKSLLEKKIGIFRSSIIKKENKLPENLSPDLLNFLKIFNSTSGQYLDINKIDNNSSLRHDLLNLNAYIHITSPIRRLVDLLNMLILQKDILSENAFEFYKNWINNIDLININMKSIRKLQNECTLLELCTNNNQLMETTYSGWIIGKKYFENNVISYNVYLPKLKLTSYVKLTEEYNVYDNLNFKLYLFTDEDNLKRKIRLAVIN
jgi:exoribonuclease R